MRPWINFSGDYLLQIEDNKKYFFAPNSLAKF